MAPPSSTSSRFDFSSSSRTVPLATDSISPLSPHEQLWRLVTSFLFAGSGLNLLFDAFLFHRTSASLENDTYLLDGAKYAWSLLWIAAGIQVRLPTCSEQLE